MGEVPGCGFRGIVIATCGTPTASKAYGVGNGETLLRGYWRLGMARVLRPVLALVLLAQLQVMVL
jgi:hypothetical protein